jgi:uncharacterized protein YukE
MADVLKVNTAELHYQLQQADDTVNQLQSHAQTVGIVTQSLGTALKGEAGNAVKVALESYTQAMADLCREHQGITEKLQAAVASYEGTDTQAAAGLTNSMKI